MHAGKTASLGLVISLTGLFVVASVGARHVSALADVHPAWRPVLAASAVAIGAAAVLVPVGIRLDRGLAEIERAIGDAGHGRRGPALARSRWLRNLGVALDTLVSRQRRRDDARAEAWSTLQARLAVAEAERCRIGAVLDALRAPVLVTDAYDEIVMANAAAAASLGFDREKALHRPLGEHLRDEELSRAIRDVRAQAAPTSTHHLDVELRSDSAAQRGTVYSASLSCVPGADGTVAGVVTILHDRTRDRELDLMKSDFVSQASHELRTPLSSIRAYVEMLVDGEATDELARHRFYAIIQREADRLGRLIDNMLDISRIESSIVEPGGERVDLETLVDRAVCVLDPQARAKDLEIVATTCGGAIVDGDADLLYQVVLNLLSNAIKYTAPGGRITVEAEPDDLSRSVVLSVADTGLGIPADAVPHLYDKFYRVDCAKHVAKGSGLGLSLCKHIVEDVHRGRIGVESAVGLGSRFWCSLPRDQAPMRRAA